MADQESERLEKRNAVIDAQRRELTFHRGGVVPSDCFALAEGALADKAELPETEGKWEARQGGSIKVGGAGPKRYFAYEFEVKPREGDKPLRLHHHISEYTEQEDAAGVDVSGLGDYVLDLRDRIPMTRDAARLAGEVLRERLAAHEVQAEKMVVRYRDAATKGKLLILGTD